MPLTIQGLGTALPPGRIAQGDAASIAAQVALPNQVPSPGQRRLLETLHRRADAALGPRGAAPGPAERITHLITVSCSGFQAPGVDLALMAALVATGEPPVEGAPAKAPLGRLIASGSLLVPDSADLI